MHDHKTMVYTGTSGLVLPVRNKLAYPPAYQDKSRLTYYASLFNSIEINSSFKKVPRGATVENWAISVPEGFRFTFKLWKGITHVKELAFNPEDVRHFIRVINHAGNKKGCLLVQFPGKVTIAHADQLENLLKLIRQEDPGHQWNIAVEFRHPSWYQPDIDKVLQMYNAGLVIHDMPASIPPVKVDASPFVYVRFHGPEKGYRGNYSDEFLVAYARQINEWKEEGKDVYVYFNNTLGDAVNNLILLNQLVQ